MGGTKEILRSLRLCVWEFSIHVLKPRSTCHLQDQKGTNRVLGSPGFRFSCSARFLLDHKKASYTVLWSQH